MFKKLSITAQEDVTVRDLLRLHEDGHSVYRTSHAGNWSLYKLLLSQLGLPDCIWDVTCVLKDVNNQPGFQLINGERIPLLEKMPEANNGTKFLTPYHRNKEDGEETLSHFHVAPLKKLFGETIRTQSEILLEFESEMATVFSIIERFMPQKLGRYVLPCGCMTILNGHDPNGLEAKCGHDRISVPRKALAESAIDTLKELKRLVLDPRGYVPKGGVIYSLELVVASFYLWSFWKFGDKPIYMLSGPDMVGYATKPEFISGVEGVLKVLGNNAPRYLIPEEFDVRIVPATFFRFGYPENSKLAERVMGAHETVRKIQALKRGWKDSDAIKELLEPAIRGATEIIKRDGQAWNLFHDPAKDIFYSQHDMLKDYALMKIMDEYLDIPFATMKKILENLSQIERGYAR